MNNIIHVIILLSSLASLSLVSLASRPIFLDKLANQSAFILPRRNRDWGYLRMGDGPRIRTAVHKLLRGENFTISVIGGSITEGQCAQSFDGQWPSWGVQLWRRLQGAFPDSHIEFTNGAHSGATSEYFSLCLFEHVSEKADLVIIEEAANESPEGQPQNRMALERLIRGCLNLPNKPLVLMLNYYDKWKGGGPAAFDDNPQEFWFYHLQLFYHLPSLSMRAALWDLFKQGAKGFRVDGFGGCILVGGRCEAGGCRNNINCTEERREEQFYCDLLHPWASTGHRALAEMAFHMILVEAEAVFSLQAEAVFYHPIGNETLLDSSNQLPDPLVSTNYERPSTACAFKDKMARLLESHNGWEFIDEAHKDGRHRWGWISSISGSKLRIKINTLDTIEVQKADLSKQMVIEVAMLHSYEQMGWASVSCEENCQCHGLPLIDLSNTNGKHESPLLMHGFKVSQHENCIIAITVVNKTGATGGFKVKVVGVAVTETGLPEAYRIV